MSATRSELVFACHSAACRPPTSGGTGGSKGTGGGGGGVARAAAKATGGGASGGGGGGSVPDMKLRKAGLDSYHAGDYKVSKNHSKPGYSITGPGLTRSLSAKTLSAATKKINTHNKGRDKPITDSDAAISKTQKSDQINAPANFKKGMGTGMYKNSPEWKTPGEHYVIRKTSKGYETSLNALTSIGTRSGGSTAIGRSPAKTLTAAKAQASAHFKKYGAEMNDRNKSMRDKKFDTMTPMRAKDTLWGQQAAAAKKKREAAAKRKAKAANG